MDEKYIGISIKNIIIDYLLESSSSDDDDEIFKLLIERKISPRVQNFIENVIHQYSEKEFKKNLRLSRKTVNHLMERYSRSYVERSYQGGRKQSSIEKQILSFLWFSGNKSTLREVANLFDMTVSNFHASFNKVLTFLVDDLAPEIIKFPDSNTEKEDIAKEFEKISGFPNVLGCIDCTYISCRTPKHQILSSSTNRHDSMYITLQGICDSKLRFLDVYTGLPSKTDDSRILKLSFIGKDLPKICSPKYYLLGDSAYPLREYLLTPFYDYENLNNSEKNYNLKFSTTHVKIENAFSTLKSRFCQLLRLDFHNAETMARFIVAVCVLHNICINNQDFFDEEVISQEIHNPDHFVEDRGDNLTQLGQIKRKDVKELLCNSLN